MSESESPAPLSNESNKRIHKRESYRNQQEEKRQKVKHARIEGQDLAKSDEVKLPKVRKTPRREVYFIYLLVN